MSSHTRIILVDRDHPDPEIVADAAFVIRQGGLVAFATETVYGLGANATDPSAVAKIYAAKGRPAFNPLIVHTDTIERARSCVIDWDDRAERLATKFWPGPLTLVLPRSKLIPDLTAGGLSTVGVRIPAPAIARALINAADCPIAAPSANRSNRISPTQASHVHDDLNGRIDLILDSGPTTVGLESTVLDLVSDRPRILRPGSVLRDQICETLGIEIEEFDPNRESARPVSPGNLPIHYAPHTPCILIKPSELPQIDLSNCALIQFGPGQAETVGKVGLNFHLLDHCQAGRELYATLHLCDQAHVRMILIVTPPEGPEWVAVRDRVTRASTPFSRKVAADLKA